MPIRRTGCFHVIKTTIIDFIAKRLPDSAAAYPDWTIRCTWARPEVGPETSETFHDGTDEHTARGLARFILDRYRDVDMRKLHSIDIRRPDGSWESVPRPPEPVTAPVRFAFQRPPRLPDRRCDEPHHA